jgi:hypothetical protein
MVVFCPPVNAVEGFFFAPLYQDAQTPMNRCPCFQSQMSAVTARTHLILINDIALTAMRKTMSISSTC